jgi:lipid-binding SYLF domain-containing protein
MRFLPELKTMWRAFSFAAVATIVFGCAHPSMVERPGKTAGGEPPLGREARVSLETLKTNNQAAATLDQKAKGVLVFPAVTKAGFMIGGFHGDGVLLKNGQVSGYYKTTGASYGLQAGVQKYGYALFFMSESALRYVDQTQGWEIGVGPSVVIVDEGKGKSLTTTTGREDVYAFIFDQRGLMAGMGLQGSKISRAH